MITLLSSTVEITAYSLDADGLPTAGDGNPTAVLWRNKASTAETVTVATTATTGLFSYTFTVPAGWSVDDVLELHTAHAISSETYRAIVWRATVYEAMRGTNSALTGLGANAPANWVNAAAIAANALDGKGNWNVGKTGYTLQATTGLGNQTANITGDLSGSVGSVTGAVGSVTGNVGGNVSGSVGSVTDPVTVGTNNDKTGYSIMAGDKDTLVDLIWDEPLTGATHNDPTSAGRRLRELGAFSIRSGTAQAGTANSITLDSGASATDEIYDSNLVVIVGGTGVGQARVIVEYNGTSKVATVDRNWEINPDNTSEFQIIADHQASITHHGIAQGGAASTITLSATASSQDSIYVAQTIYIGTSNGAGQSRLITAYNGTTKVATVSPAWEIEPTSSSVYLILPTGRVTVDSNHDKTGYSLSQAFPANFAALGINASGHIERTVLNDTTTTNTDMRGTDNALTTLGDNAPAGWINAASIANGAFASAKFASDYFTSMITAIWVTAATRTMTAFGFAVETDEASRNASKADVSGLATSAEQTSITNKLNAIHGTDPGADDTIKNAVAQVSRIPRADEPLEPGATARHELTGGSSGVDIVQIRKPS